MFDQDQYVSQPAADGTVAGLGESFTLNLNTGQGMFSQSITTPDGVAGHTPKLSLEYSSTRRHSAFGWGWALNLRQITHRRGRYYDGGQELLPLGGGFYGPAIERAFDRYELTDVGTWIIHQRNGHKLVFGDTLDSRLADPGIPTRVQAWYMTAQTDTCGNRITYTYDKDGHLPYLRRVTYAVYRVDFDYEAREDARTIGQDGYLTVRSRRCNRIRLGAMVAGSLEAIKSWSLHYQYSPGGHVSQLRELRLTGHDGPAANDISQPATTFTYGSDEPSVRPFVEIEPAEGHPSPPPLTGTDTKLVTLESAPLPGILTNTNGRQYYWANDGTGRWSAPRRIEDTPLVDDFAVDGAFFLDADGSGRPDLLTAGANPLRGYYSNEGEDGWGQFRAYPRGNTQAPPWRSSIALDDTNGDGLIDVLEDHGRSFAVWENRGADGWAAPTLRPKTGDDARSVDLSDPNVRLADMTGDGKRDLVRLRSGGIEYWPCLGPGSYGDPVIMSQSPRLSSATRLPEHLFLLDVNRTGCTDLVVLDHDSIRIYLNRNGEGFAAAKIIEGIFPPLPGTIRAADFMGTGGAGLFYNTASGKSIYQPLGTEVGALAIVACDNGFGLHSTLTYRSAIEELLRDRLQGRQWSTHFPFALTVVAETWERDSITGHEVRVGFAYHEAHFETRNRQFQGFANVVRTEFGDDSRPDRLTVHYFHAGEELSVGAGPERAALNGQLHRKEVFRAGADLVTEIEEATYELNPIDAAEDGRPRYFLSVAQTRTHRHDETADVSALTTAYEYDGFGNATRETKTGSGIKAGVAVEQKTVDTQLSYAINEEQWVIDRIATKVQRNGAGSLLAEARNYYDGADFTGLPLGEVTRGLRTRQELFVLNGEDFQRHYAGTDLAALGYTIGPDANGDAAAFIQQERFAYAANGLRTASRNALNQDSNFAFDDDGLFKTSYTTAMGTTRYTVTPGRGRVTRINSPEGTQVRLSYDALERLRTIFLPDNDSDTPSREYRYSDAALPASRITRYFLSDDPQDFTTVHTYFNGRLKEVQSRVEQSDNRYVASSYQENNPFGDLRAEYEPFIANTPEFGLPDPNSATAQRFAYDVSGRPVRTENFFGGISTAQYTPFDITTRDAYANDDSTTAPAQLRGLRKIESIDPFNHRVGTVRELADGEQLRLTYRLTELGQLQRIDDAHGELARYLYDRVGNRLVVDHREAGHRAVQYDATGKPTRGTDALGNVITSDYDPATPRLLRLLHDGNEVESYDYDQVTGKLNEVSYTGGRLRLGYDAAGRVNRNEYFHEGRNNPDVIGYEFDRVGRRTANVHTDGTRAAYGLYRNGWVRSIQGVVDQIDYDAFGNPVRIQYHNGVVAERSYGPGGRKMMSQRTTNGGLTLEHVSYTYDVAGNMATATDHTTTPDQVTRFTYDTLSQLTETDVNGTTDRFDLAGLELLGLDGRAFQYDDAAKPHRLTEIIDGANQTGLRYDANGNLLNLPGREFTYNFKNELTRCRRDDGLSADYFYDHTGMRVRKDVSDGNLSRSTRFVEDQAEYRDGIATYYYTIGRVRVGMLQDGRMRYIHSSYLGNSGFFTDDTGTRIEAIAYSPYGNPTSTTGSSRLAAFATHPYDEESGLYYMRRRYYAPEIGRFTSADLVAVYLPLKVIGDPVALHAYAYAGNNPANNIDLEGTSFWSVVGGIVGAIVGVALAVMLSPLAAILIGVGIMLAAYFIADANVGNDFGEFMRGFMIGFNAGMNLVYASILFGPVIGTAVGVINFLAVEESLTRNPVFEGILGWTSWLMPMSWLVTGVGLIFFVINLIVAGVTFQQVDRVAITSINVDWRRGMINMEGGAIRAAGGGAAFNMGNFSFYDVGRLGFTEHEIGHGLNLAAFGWAFHYIGAIDQAADPNFGFNSGVYAEDLAEGSMATPRWNRPGLDMWES